MTAQQPLARCRVTHASSSHLSQAGYVTPRTTAVFGSATPTCAASTIGVAPVTPTFTGSAPITILAAKARSTACPPVYTNVGASVTLTGVITGLDVGGFYMQDNNLPTPTGIFVAYVDSHAGTTQAVVLPDNQVTVTGTLKLVGGQLQLIASAAPTAPTPVLALSYPLSFVTTQCGNLAFEGVLVTLGSATITSATTSPGNQFGWLSAGNVPVVATHSYMRAFQQGASLTAPTGGFALRGVLVGTPATGNLFSAISPRGLVDLGIIQASGSFAFNATCGASGTSTAGQPAGGGPQGGCAAISASGMNSVYPGTAAPTGFIPTTIYNIVQRPYTGSLIEPAFSAPSSSFDPLTLTSGVAFSTTASAALASSTAYAPLSALGSGGASGVFTYPFSNSSTSSSYSPYVGQFVYVEGLYTAPLPSTAFYAMAAGQCDSSDTTCSVKGASVAYFAGTIAPGVSCTSTPVANVGPTNLPNGTADPNTIAAIAATSGGTWCASCSFPNGFYLGTDEVSGTFSGVMVDLQTSQVGQLYTPITNPPTAGYTPDPTVCPSTMGSTANGIAYLVPTFPSPTTTMRVGVGAQVQQSAAGVILSTPPSHPSSGRAAARTGTG